MDLTLIFSLLTHISFNVQFLRNSASYQDFFLFSSTNDYIHMLRNDSKICLIKVDGENYTRYEIEIYDAIINFEWPLTVNNKTMMPVMGYGEHVFKSDLYTSFTFIDPISMHRGEIQEVINVNKDLPYDVLIGILTIFVIITKLPDIVTVIRSRVEHFLARESLV